jgi:uncharacterized protein YdbL (DUF1318 family)
METLKAINARRRERWQKKSVKEHKLTQDGEGNAAGGNSDDGKMAGQSEGEVEGGGDSEWRPSIDYVNLNERHLEQVNQMLSRQFWPGINGKWLQRIFILMNPLALTALFGNFDSLRESAIP